MKVALRKGNKKGSCTCVKAIVNKQLFVVVVVGFFLAGIFFPEIFSRARQVPNTESTTPIAIQSLVIRLFSFDEAIVQVRSFERQAGGVCKNWKIASARHIQPRAREKESCCLGTNKTGFIPRGAEWWVRALLRRCSRTFQPSVGFRVQKTIRGFFGRDMSESAGRSFSGSS